MKQIKALVEIICDGGQKYGVGHIRRSTTLAHELKENGYKVKLTILSNIYFDNHLVFDLSEHRPDICIIDLPYDIKKLNKNIGNLANIIIALDYFGDFQPDLVISIYEHKYPIPSGSRVCGLKYAIIRKEISELVPACSGTGVVVMIGGSDINHYGEKIAYLVSELGINVKLIQGPAFTGDYQVQSPNVEILKNPKDLGTIMSDCEWAVTNGGGSMMEMMYLGKAVYVIPQTKEEEKLAQLVFKQKGILGIGIDSIKLPSKDMIMETAIKAHSLVDGKGVGRIIELIDNYVD